MSSTASAALAEPWKELWNGDLAVTDKIIAEGFIAHAAPLTGTPSSSMYRSTIMSRPLSSATTPGGSRSSWPARCPAPPSS